MKYAQIIAATATDPYVEAAAFYLIVTTPLINYVGKLEHRLALSEGAQGATQAKKRKRGELLPAAAPVAHGETPAKANHDAAQAARGHPGHAGHRS